MIGNSSRIVRNTVILYVRMFLTMAVSLYTVRVVLRVLTEVDYGIFSAVGGILAAFAVVTKPSQMPLNVSSRMG